jgi:hypothetical protein
VRRVPEHLPVAPPAATACGVAVAACPRPRLQKAKARIRTVRHACRHVCVWASVRVCVCGAVREFAPDHETRQDRRRLVVLRAREDVNRVGIIHHNHRYRSAPLRVHAHMHTTKRTHARATTCRDGSLQWHGERRPRDAGHHREAKTLPQPWRQRSAACAHAFETTARHRRHQSGRTDQQKAHTP